MLRKLAFFLILLFLAHPVATKAQSLTLRYNPPASGGCSGTGPITCSISLSTTPIISGDLLAYSCQASQTTILISVGNTGPFKPVNAGYSPAFAGAQLSSGFVYPAAAETGTETVSFFYPNPTTPGVNGSCFIWEYSVSGGTPQYDGGNSIEQSAANTTLAMPSFIPSSGSSDTFIEQVSGGAVSSVSAPFTRVGNAAHLDNNSSPQGPTFTYTGSVAPAQGIQMEFGFNVTPPINGGFIDFSGTPGAQVTQASLQASTHGLQHLWNQTGSGNFALFTYQTAASRPLSGSTGRLADGKTYTDTSTTGIQLATGTGSAGLGWQIGAISGIISTGVVGGAITTSTDLPASDGTDIDDFNIRGSGNTDYVNAGMYGNGVNRVVTMECGASADDTTQDYITIPGNTYTNEIIYTPEPPSVVNVSGTNVTWVSGPKFTSALQVATWSVFIGYPGIGTKPFTPYRFTILTINSPTSITLTSCPVTACGSESGVIFQAANYVKTYIGWQSPSAPGTLAAVLSCPVGNTSGTYYPSVIDFGQASAAPLTAGHVVNYDSIIYSLDGPLSKEKDCIAASNSISDVQTALNSCLAGGVVILPRGSATWGSTKITGAITGPVTVVGQTVCLSGCNPGSEGVGLAFQDNTIITTSKAGASSFAITGCTSTNVFRLTGITFINTLDSGSTLNGAVNIACVHGQTNAARVDHLNVTNQAGTFLTGSEGWGLIDHILYNDQTGVYSFMAVDGDEASVGYLDWQQPTNLGSAESWILEDSSFPLLHNPITDGTAGCKITVRHNQINARGVGQVHGTDSGGARSCIAVEIYNNTFTSNAIGFGIWNGSRGGTVLVHDNVINGTANWNGIELDYFRASATDFGVAGSWGLAGAGLNWTPQVQGGTNNTLNASAWQTGHVYAANSVVTLSTCNVQTTAGGTTSGSAPSCPALGSTITDSGGVVWKNVGGTTSAGPGGAGFLSTDNETTCVSGVNCTRFFDTNGGVYPFRDQPCVIHGQVTFGCYQWNNTGTRVPANWWNSDAPSAVQLNRDYFNAQPAGYASYTYPDPLQGGVVVTSSPAVGLAPTSLTFASLAVGSSSSPQTVTLKNTGTATLSLSSISITGNNPTSFSQNNLCGSSLGVNQSCQINVIFQPQAAGALSANLTFVDNASNSPQNVPLSGTGTSNAGISFNPTSLNFGNSLEGVLGTQTVIVMNTGSANLTISSVVILDGTGSYSHQPDSCVGTPIAPNGTCNLVLGFNATQSGTLNGTAQINDNVTGSPQSINMVGVGIILVPSPSVLSFGPVVQGKFSVNTINISNPGFGALGVSSISISGAAASDFSQLNNCLPSVPAHSSCQILVTFMPNEQGRTDLATLTINAGAIGNPFTVPLSGIGLVLSPAGIFANDKTFAPALTLGNDLIRVNSQE